MLTIPHPDAVIRSIEALVPTLRARRGDIEQARRMPRDLVDQLQQTGVFSLVVPRAIGGAEATPMEILRAIETAAAGDGSAGWIVMIGASGNMTGGYMAEPGAREVFADPTKPTAGIAAPAGAATPVAGGVRVSGRWTFASGIDHCDWLWAGCLVMDNGQPKMTPQGPEIVHVWMPASEVTIHDTWHVSGLCGTGSNDFTATDVFVPERRIFRLLDPSGHRSEPLYRMPPVTEFVFMLVGVPLGIARAALDEFAELAQTKVPTFYQDVLADKAVVQVELARAEAALGAARSFVYERVQDMWDTVNAGRTPTPRQLALARAATNHAVETAAAVTHTVNTLAGGSSIYTKSSLQRHARDAEAVTHHFTAAAHLWEEAGRVLLGRKPIAPVI